MKVLFLTHPYPNYVPDLLLHGLRKLIGPDVVDFPRKDCLYNGVLGLGVCPSNQLCPGWFPNDGGSVDRDDITGKIEKGFFDCTVSDVRAIGQWMPFLERSPTALAIVDGEDHPVPIRPGRNVVFRRETDGADFSVPLPMALPEEIFNWIVSYDSLPKQYSIGFLGSTHDDGRRQLVEQLASLYPDCLFSASAVPSEDNPFPEGRFGRDEYYQELQKCRLVLSLPGAGYDTFRFWENAACHAVHVSQRVPLFVPDDFLHGKDILRFDGIDQLRAAIDSVLEGRISESDIIINGRKNLIRNHFTQHRAAYLLEQVRSMLGAAAKGGIQTTSIDWPRGNRAAEDVSVGANSVLKTDNGLPLFVGLVEGKNYGWGVCSRYLIRELSRLTDCRILNKADKSAQDENLEGKLFQALTGVDFFPMFEKARGRQNYGYTFFENELTRHSLENAKRYDLILGGSSWCRDRMLERGITHCGVLIQGIDPELFFPVEEEKEPERFVIFSGGKFELRKGQDLVLKAFKTLQDKYPDMWLVNCWYNIWPESMRLMSHSSHVRFEVHPGSWQEKMQHTYALNGLDSSRIVTCDLMPAELQRELYRNTDVGVFPNRCEGGTNLVLMEYMACGKPVIASCTSGHQDIISEGNALLLKDLKDYHIAGPDRQLFARWQEPSLDELIARIEWAYHHRDETRRLGRNAGDDLKRFTWEACARRLLSHIFPS
jgi:glycosyltransferase involved in cell wall biosynthesis